MGLFLLLYLISFIIWWGYSGYFIFLYLIYLKNKSVSLKQSNLRNSECYHNTANFPTITILVPCYNEEILVEKKIKNLLSLDYPKEKLEIIFLDGKSTDNTFSVLNETIKNSNSMSYVKAIQTNIRGKILQLNFILKELKSDIIINTDMDGILKENALIEIVKEFKKDEKIGIIGAFIIPENCSPEENYHWDTQNRIRIMESLAYSSSVIIAVCYAFKNGIINEFPEDVIADDVYLAFEANLKGYKVIYSTNAIGVEMRASQSKKEFIKHKLRKTNANIVETLKYISKFPEILNGSFMWTIIFTTRTLQVLIIPLLTIFYVIFCLFMIYNKYYKPIISLFIVFIISFLTSYKILHSIKLPGYNQGKKQFNLFTNLITHFLLGIIMIYSVLIYPFYKQDSSYKRIGTVK